MIAHPDTYLRLEELGARIPPYAPNHTFPGPFIDPEHAKLAQLPLKDGMLIQMRRHPWPGGLIQGWLMREDALKLYELAYFATAPILELGSFHGLSTAILSRANRSSSSPQPIETVDLDPVCTRTTRQTLLSLGLTEHVRVTTGDAASVVERYAATGMRCGLVFVDHSHAYEPVRAVCTRLAEIVEAGGFCLFHDFNDPRNRNPQDPDHAVYQAVQDGLDRKVFEFYGIYGCTGLYRAKT